MKHGYAALTLENNEILVATVSPSETAAMVNWLVVYGGFMVPQGMGDFAIREHFARLATPYKTSIRKVRIELA